MERPRRLDLRSLLTRAEAAAPVGVVDAMAGALQEMLGAHDVSFLIADFSGRSLNRLGHTADDGGPGSRSEETARAGAAATARPTAPRSPRSAPWCSRRATTPASSRP